VIELQDIVAEEAAPEPAFELVEEPAPAAETVDLSQVLPAEPGAEPAPASGREFELELTAQAKSTRAHEPATTEDFISDLVAEIDGFEAPPAVTSAPGSLSKIFEQEPQPMKAVTLPHVPEPTNGNAAEPAGPQVTAESLNQLSEVFQEFRAELGEMGSEDEDLETHYNLGIAFREMGLLEEAIGEFQKVAKANDRGKAFRYAMQCCTLLGLAFMEKGQPNIAAIWYERALNTPGVDGESKLALRYDLGVAQESAGDLEAALKSFSQVYAVNIDYRDVAERIASLQKPAR